MSRAIAVVGAPSSIGIRPYDDGQKRHLDRAPAVLRERRVVARLNATDFGDVNPPAYRDYERPPDRPRNEKQVVSYSRALADRVAAASRRRFALVLGGDCSIVLGCLLGAQRAVNGPVGLVYLDAHADFATPEESQTGSIAGMSLALASGRGGTPLARLAGRAPLVEDAHIALIGRRTTAAATYGESALASSLILDLPASTLVTRPPDAAVEMVLGRVASRDLAGFWIHLDVDVLNPIVMPAVDSPEPGGLTTSELTTLLTPLVSHPRALGLSLAIYDPALDADRSCARQLARLLETLLRRPGS